MDHHMKRKEKWSEVSRRLVLMTAVLFLISMDDGRYGRWIMFSLTVRCNANLKSTQFSLLFPFSTRVRNRIETQRRKSEWGLTGKSEKEKLKIENVKVLLSDEGCKKWGTKKSKKGNKMENNVFSSNELEHSHIHWKAIWNHRNLRDTISKSTRNLLKLHKWIQYKSIYALKHEHTK